MKVLLRDTEVAELFGIGRATVWQWVQKGTLPRPVAIGERIKRWRGADLQSLIDESKPADAGAA